MTVSTKASYAVRVACALAAMPPSGYVPVHRLATESDVPYEFARSVCCQMARTGLLDSKRGARGGVRLARPAAEVSVQDVIRSIDDSARFAQCLTSIYPCPRLEVCPIHLFWQEIDGIVASSLETKTLEDLVGKVPTGE